MLKCLLALTVSICSLQWFVSRVCGTTLSTLSAAECGIGASFCLNINRCEKNWAPHKIMLVAFCTRVSALNVFHSEPGFIFVYYQIWWYMTLGRCPLSILVPLPESINQAELESVRARPKGGGRPFPSSSSLLLSSLELSDTKDYEP